MSDPMSVGDCLGVTATVTHGGKVYTVGRPTPAALAAVEEEIAKAAWAEAQAMAAVAPGLADDVRGRLLARQHRVGGPLWDKVFQTVAANVLQLWALLAPHHPEVTPADAEALFLAEPDQCELALLLTAPDFSAAVARRGKAAPQRVAAARAAAETKVAEKVAEMEAKLPKA